MKEGLVFTGLLASCVALVVLPSYVDVVPKRIVVEYQLRKAAHAYGLPVRLFRSLVWVESRFKPDALSPKGAIGLAQIMPFNAGRCGLEKWQLWLIKENLFCGAQILREEIDRLGTIEEALAVYNCGKPTCKAGLKYARMVLHHTSEET